MSTDSAHRFGSLVDYLWASDRDLLDSLHAGAHAPTFEDGLAAGWARAVKALGEPVRQMQDAGPLHYFDCARLDPPTHAGATKKCDCLADRDLAAAARALTERGPG